MIRLRQKLHQQRGNSGAGRESREMTVSPSSAVPGTPTSTPGSDRGVVGELDLTPKSFTSPGPGRVFDCDTNGLSPASGGGLGDVGNEAEPGIDCSVSPSREQHERAKISEKGSARLEKSAWAKGGGGEMTGDDADGEMSYSARADGEGVGERGYPAPLASEGRAGVEASGQQTHVASSLKSTAQPSLGPRGSGREEEESATQSLAEIDKSIHALLDRVRPNAAAATSAEGQAVSERDRDTRGGKDRGLCAKCKQPVYTWQPRSKGPGHR